MVRGLTPHDLCELTDAEDGDDDDDDAQENREKDWPPASPRAGPRTGGLGDWGRPARHHPLFGARWSVRARMIVIAHVHFLPHVNGGAVTGCRPQEDAGTNAVSPLSVKPMIMSSKTHVSWSAAFISLDV